MHVDLIEDPNPLSDGCVRFRMRASEKEFEVTLFQDRAIGTPSRLELPLAQAATEIVDEYCRNNRWRVHCLLREARSIASPHVLATMRTRVEDDPRVDGQGNLVLGVTLDERGTAEIVVASSLRPVTGGFVDGSECTDEEYSAAYDAALDYMADQVSRLESIGFDSACLRQQLDEEAVRRRG
jgi:hypothetical protein